MGWPIAAAAAASLAGSFLASSSSADAAEMQAETMAEVYQWGYGYPDWLVEGIEEMVATYSDVDVDEYASQLYGQYKSQTAQELEGVREMLKESYAARGLAGSGLELAGMEDLYKSYLSTLGTGYSQAQTEAAEYALNAATGSISAATGIPSYSYTPSTETSSQEIWGTLLSEMGTSALTALLYEYGKK